MKGLLVGLCWALAASVLTLAVFGSYFKASAGATSPKTHHAGPGCSTAGRGSSGIRMGCGEGAGSAAEAQLQKSLLTAEQEQGVQTPGCAKRGFSPPRSSHSQETCKNRQCSSLSL